MICWFEPEGDAGPFLPGRFPVFIWEPEDGNAFTCFPLVAGENGVKTVFFRAGGVPCDPDALDRHVRDEEIEFAPVIGEILADLATHGATLHPIEMFLPAASVAFP